MSNPKKSTSVRIPSFSSPHQNESLLTSIAHSTATAAQQTLFETALGTNPAFRAQTSEKIRRYVADGRIAEARILKQAFETAARANAAAQLQTGSGVAVAAGRGGEFGRGYFGLGNQGLMSAAAAASSSAAMMPAAAAAAAARRENQADNGAAGRAARGLEGRGAASRRESDVQSREGREERGSGRGRGNEREKAKEKHKKGCLIS